MFNCRPEDMVVVVIVSLFPCLSFSFLIDWVESMYLKALEVLCEKHMESAKQGYLLNLFDVDVAKNILYGGLHPLPFLWIMTRMVTCMISHSVVLHPLPLCIALCSWSDAVFVVVVVFHFFLWISFFFSFWLLCFMVDLCSACNAVSYLNHKFGISGPAAFQLLVFLKWKKNQSFLYLSRVGYSGNSRLFELVDTVNLFTVMFLTFT